MKHATNLQTKLCSLAFSLILCLGLFLSVFEGATLANAGATQLYPEVQLPAPNNARAVINAVLSPNATTNSHPGTIYYGAVPANSSSKPVLLFVHGLGGEASDWFTNGNDMFSYAYNAGFRDAAVDLYPSGSVWTNGQLLSNLIQQICAHYGVATLNVVAHSKGGIDTQSAIDFYGAAPYVQNEVTLDTPHHGSQLADLAYSWWSWWIAAILGQRSDATYDLQTSYMSYFRSVADGNSNNRYVDLFTTSGTSHSSPIELFFGGLYLSQYGPNDGAVTVASSYNPNGEPIYSFNLNHYDVAVGHNSFNVIKPYINYGWRGSNAVASSNPIVNANASMNIAPASNLILRGGKLAARNRANEQFMVESNVSSVSIQLLTENGDLNAVAVGPHGERVPFSAPTSSSNATEQIFKGAQQLTATIANPAAGNWHIELNAPARGDASYLLMANLQSNLQLNLKVGNGSDVAYAPGSNLALSLSGVDNNVLPLRDLKVEGYVLGNNSQDNRNTPSVHANGRNTAVSNYRLPNKEGVYNLSLTVTGLTSDGKPFERSLTTSVLVGTAQSLAVHSSSLEGK